MTSVGCPRNNARALVSVALLSLLWRVGVADAAAHLRVDVVGELRCPSEAQVTEALARRDLSGSEGTGRRLSLRLRVVHEGLLKIMLLEEGVALMQRTLPMSRHPCHGLANTVALVAEAWLRQLPSSATRAPHQDSRSERARRSRTAVTAMLPSPIAVRPVAEAPPLPAPITAATQPSSRSTTFTWRARAPRRLVHLSVALAAGGFVGMVSDPTGGYIAAIGAELGLGERFALGVRALYQGAFSATSGPGVVTVQQLPVALFGRVALHRLDRPGISLDLGIIADLVSAKSTGFSTTRSVVLVEPGLFFGVSGEWTFRQRFFLFGRASASVLLRSVYFEITNLGAIVSTPRAWAEFEGGIGYRIF